MSGGSNVAIDLQAADQIVESYRATSAALDGIRRSLTAPWASATTQLGDRHGSVPDVLRGLVEQTNAGARDLEWRVDYIRARYGEAHGSRLVVVHVPRRLPELQRVSTAQLVERLKTDVDPGAIVEVLHELLARGAGNVGVAVEVVRRLTAEDVDRLLGHPDLISGLEDLLLPLQLLVGYAHTAQPMEVAHLLAADQPIDVHRIVLLLSSGGYPAASVADVLFRVDELMSNPSFAFRYALLPATLQVVDSEARRFLAEFENPRLSVMAAVTDPPEALALLQMPGMVELLLNTPANLAGGQGETEALAKANAAVGRLLDIANQHLASLFDRVASADPGAVEAFEKALSASYDILLGLRDMAPAARVSGDAVRRPAARLMTWHFSELAKGGWPLGESAGEFARWLAESPEAMEELILGTSTFVVTLLPRLVTQFEGEPAAGEVAAAIPLDQLKTVIAFFTIALQRTPVSPEQMSDWRLLIDTAWTAALTVGPGVLIEGKGSVYQLLRLALRRLASSSFTFIADSGGPAAPADVGTVRELLAHLFFTIDGFGGSNDLEAVRPLQIALFAELLGFHLDAVDLVPALGDFIIEGHLVPPSVEAPEYERFLEIFAEATTTESDLARHYIGLWNLITEWATKGVAAVEIPTS